MFDKVIALDIETTGFKPGKAHLLEIGALCYNPKDQSTIEFNCLVRTNVKIPDRITRLTGINNFTLIEENAQPLKIALNNFIKFIQDNSDNPLFVSHNGFAFDYPFLNHFLGRLGLPLMNEKVSWDTILQMRADVSRKRARTFRSTQQEAKRYRVKSKTNLLAACDYYKVDTILPNHRALADARNCLGIFKKQLARNKWIILKT